LNPLGSYYKIVYNFISIKINFERQITKPIWKLKAEYYYYFYPAEVTSRTGEGPYRERSLHLLGVPRLA